LAAVAAVAAVATVGGHLLEHLTPRGDADVRRFEGHPLDQGEARPEVPRQHDRPVSTIENQPGRGVHDQGPGQDARVGEEGRHPRLPFRRGRLVSAKVGEQRDGQTLSNVVR
jgi:hypothetical protein